MEDAERVFPPWPSFQKKRKTSCDKRKEEPEEEGSALHSLSSNNSHLFSYISASFDLAFLDCPSCKKPLQSPIYQCYSGHYACSSCNDANMRKCTKCSKHTGEIRNIGLESIIKTLRIKCTFSSSGCKEVLRHCERKDHEMVCFYAPHMCPILDCDFCGLLKDFVQHFTVQHKARSLEFPASKSISFTLSKNDIYIVLQVKNKPMFLMHNKQETVGNIVHLTSFCSSPSNSNVRWGYELNVYKGKTTLTLNSVALSHENLMVEARTADFLVIPKHFFDIDIDATSNIVDLRKKVDVEISMQTELNGFKLHSR